MCDCKFLEHSPTSCDGEFILTLLTAKPFIALSNYFVRTAMPLTLFQSLLAFFRVAPWLVRRSQSLQLQVTVKLMMQERVVNSSWCEILGWWTCTPCSVAHPGS
jgi:hypothetical protein